MGVGPFMITGKQERWRQRTNSQATITSFMPVMKESYCDESNVWGELCVERHPYPDGAMSSAKSSEQEVMDCPL